MAKIIQRPDGFIEINKASVPIGQLHPSLKKAEAARAARIHDQQLRQDEGFRRNCEALDRRDVARKACGRDNDQSQVFGDGVVS